MLVKQKEKTMITRERYNGNVMTKKQFNSWVRKNTKLMCDGTGYLYGVSLKEFDVDFNLLSVKNKKEAIEKLINNKELYKRYTGEMYTSMFTSDWANTETYIIGCSYGYDYKKLK